MNATQLEMVNYGVFDSRAHFPRAITTQPRKVTNYELEIYTEDQPGTAYFDNNTTFPLLKGTILCAKPGQFRHSKLHFKCLHLRFQTRDPILRNALERMPLCFITSDLTPYIELFHNILMVDRKLFPTQKLLLHSYFFKLIYTILEEAGTSEVTASAASSEHRKVMAAVEKHIRKNLSQELDLKSLAAVANLSPVYFHKLFCSHFGMTPAAFVQSCRIAAAKGLLKAGDLPISEVAAQCGFSSQSYFNYRFREVTGETPLQYRKARLSRLKV